MVSVASFADLNFFIFGVAAGLIFSHFGFFVFICSIAMFGVYEVPAPLMLYVGVLFWLNGSWFVTSISLLVPLGYFAFLFSIVFKNMKKSGFTVYKALVAFPLGKTFFDHVVIPVLAPHKAVYKVRMIQFTETRYSLLFYFLHLISHPLTVYKLTLTVVIG